MDNVLMAGLSRQIALMRQVDALANNIANASTTGFKAEFMVESAVSQLPASSNVGPREVLFAETAQVLRDFGQGPLEQTGREFDMALTGEGFFNVTSDKGPAYTRDGAFSLDANGKLVTKTGEPVLSDAGSEITVPQGASSIGVAQDGTVRAGDTVIGKIGVFKFENAQVLSPMGGNLFSAGAQAAKPAENAKISQGYLESANVKPVLQMTQLLEATRTYESITRSMRAVEDLRSRSIERLGRPQ